jgi:hypothetical protein
MKGPCLSGGAPECQDLAASVLQSFANRWQGGIIGAVVALHWIYLIESGDILAHSTNDGDFAASRRL